eukprot:UN03902
MLITCGMPKQRVTLGAQIGFAVLKTGLVKQDKSSLSGVVVVGTQMDCVKKKRHQHWLDKIAPAFTEKLGGKPGHVVLTALEQQEDDDGEDNTKDLLDALEKDWELLKILKYTQPTTDELVRVLGESTGMVFG